MGASMGAIVTCLAFNLVALACGTLRALYRVGTSAVFASGTDLTISILGTRAIRQHIPVCVAHGAFSAIRLDAVGHTALA